MTLSEQLAHWDGKAVDILEFLYQQKCTSDDFIHQLVCLTVDKHCSVAATWLLKYHVDKGGVFDPKEVTILYSHCSLFSSWQAKLHVLQVLHVMPIQYAEKAVLEHFLRSCLSDENKFLRAWAYNGLYLFAKQYPQYQNEATAFFKLAMRDESASVKARVRKIMNNGFD